MNNCKICSGSFEASPDSLILCEHHNCFVHLGCCVNRCSYDKQPCKHAAAVYDKL